MENFDIDRFLRTAWQKQPLLIRNPWAAWRNPLTPDELAGLACEEDVEARLIERDRHGWRLSHGPFTAARFRRLGRNPWTLLVQAVDHYVPDVAALIAPFRFLPNWRIDDVMVSYASDRAGVGPHFDNYDVFLIQGLGRRRWRVGPRCDDTAPLLPHDDLRLLASFEASEEWLLEPGDILYLPPGFAHDGVAVGDDCMTYSIGFRAPSRAELIAGWCDHLLDTLPNDDRYADPDLRAAGNPGEISTEALTRLQAMVTESLSASLNDRGAFARWFGHFTTGRKYPDCDWRPDAPIDAMEVRACLAEGDALWRDPASRFAFIRQADDAIILFVDGESFICSGAAARFAEQICAREHVHLPIGTGSADEEALLALIVTLFNQGSLAFDKDD